MRRRMDLWVEGSEIPNEHEVRCNCGKKMFLRRHNSMIYQNSGENRLFYACPDFPVCRTTLGAHPDGEPLGFVGDEETRALRCEAHNVMDEFIARTGVRKHDVYRLLQNHYNGEKVHFAGMSKEELRKAIDFLRGLPASEVVVVIKEKFPLDIKTSQRAKRRGEEEKRRSRKKQHFVD